MTRLGNGENHVNRLRLRAIALLLLLWLSALPALAQGTLTGKVVGVSDGDTLTVLVDGRRQVKVRLHGIDAPESHQAYGSRAKQFTSEAAFGQAVRVQVQDTDRYGRSVALVFLHDGQSLNQALLRAGMAWWYRQYAPNDRTFQALEEEARRARRGLWSEPDPVPPWSFRRNGGERKTAAPPSGGAALRPAASPVQPAPASAEQSGGTIYVTATGKKYHRDGCRYLSMSQRATTKRDVEKRGLTPCSVCRP
jgi:micrococcal nuclease